MELQAGCRKARGTRDQIANICWIMEKARAFQKNSTSALLTMPKSWLCGSPQTVVNDWTELWFPRDQSPLCILFCLPHPGNTCLPNICVFISMWILSPCWSPSPLLPASSFVLRWYLKWEFHPFWQVSQFSWSLPCTCVIKLLFDFFLLFYLMSV